MPTVAELLRTVLRRLKGELLLKQGDDAEAETSLHQAESCFQHAIEVARRQQAKALLEESSSYLEGRMNS